MMKHLLRDIASGRDPEARPEAFAYCSFSQETTWDLRHDLTTDARDADCPTCLRVFSQEKKFLSRPWDVDVR